MKRASTHPQKLKHLPFFEVLASAPEGSPDARLATAGLLTMRMIDHWVLAGPAIVEPESVSVRSVRQAIMDVPAKEPVRDALLTIVNTMQMIRQVDLTPVLPRVFAYAQLLERHYGALALAADCYESVIRLADVEYDAELVMDGYVRLSFCQRKLGALDDAAESSTRLARIAGKRKDRARSLRAKIGLGLVSMMRGDLAEADTQFVAVTTEAQRHELTREFAAATHNRAVVASRAGNATDAVILAHEALKNTMDAVERDRVLNDLAAFLIQADAYDAALDALRVLEVTAASDEPRAAAKVNIVVVAARLGNRALFDAARAELESVRLPIEAQLNLWIESARGLQAFGEPDSASDLLDRASALANAHGLTGAVDDIAKARTAPARPYAPASGTTVPDGPARFVVSELRQMAAAIAA